MKGTVLAGYTLAVRTPSNVDTGVRLKPGDVVYGDVNASSGRNRIYFDTRIYRATGVVESLTPGIYNAATDNDGEPIVKWVLTVDEAEPGTTPDPQPEPQTKTYTEFRRETYPDGSVWEGQATFTLSKVA